MRIVYFASPLVVMKTAEMLYKEVSTIGAFMLESRHTKRE